VKKTSVQAVDVVVFTHGLSQTTGIGTALHRFCASNPSLRFLVFAPAGQVGDPPPNVTAVPVRCFERPLALLFLTFPIGVLLQRSFWQHRRSSSTLACDPVFPAAVLWAHFNHRTYLRHHHSFRRPPRSLAEAGRIVDHLLRAAVERFALAHSTVLVTPSLRLRSEFQIRPALRSIIFPNLPNESRVWRYEPSERESQTAVVVAGGAFERKGVFTIIEALASIPNLHLRVIGGASHDLDAGQHAAEQHGVQDRVQFIGTVSKPSAHVGGTHFGIFASSYEVASIALLEAVAGGFPVVVTRAGQAAELVEDGVNGIVADQSSIEDVRHAILRMLELRLWERPSVPSTSWTQVLKRYEAANMELVETLVGPLSKRRPA
jgi:glycosyltransferase involved in cell wall biosynthesis